MGDNGRQFPGQIHRQSAAGASDHDERAARAYQACHPLKASGGVHVVKGRDTRHEVEALGLKRVREYVPDDVGEVGSSLRPGELDAGCVRIEPYDVLDPVSQFSGELAFAAADVEGAAASVRNSRKNQWMVVDVVVPAPGLGMHLLSLPYGGPGVSRMASHSFAVLTPR